MATTVKRVESEEHSFGKASDSVSETYGDGYDVCGPRVYTLAELDSEGNEIAFSHTLLT
jgi:hypothetical protein